MIPFTIYRPEWLHGEGVNPSRLLRSEDGKKCCFGQLAILLGIPRSEIQNIGAVSDVDPAQFTRLPEAFRPRPLGQQYYYDTPLACQIMRTNDIELGDEPWQFDPQLNTGPEREARLIELFAKADIELSFSDEMPDYLKV